MDSVSVARTTPIGLNIKAKDSSLIAQAVNLRALFTAVAHNLYYMYILQNIYCIYIYITYIFNFFNYTD